MKMPRSAYLVAVLAAFVAACAPQIRQATPRPAPENFPRADYERAAAQGKPVYRVDPEGSLVTITVRRGGSLARLGHDHVVASHAAQGYVSLEEGRADLYVPLDTLSVDEPALRAEAGLDTQPSESDIAATRSNMLDKVLATQQFPFALIRVSSVEKIPAGLRMAVALTLHGATRTFAVPAQIETGSDGMSVAGSFEFNQSDFGIVPFSILSGAVQVQDRLSLRFRIRAAPWPTH
ncbi:MAG: YceI family protein [Variovorax sp.]|nr:MAG: YceI family protein [Variovorax sp.]